MHASSQKQSDHITRQASHSHSKHGQAGGPGYDAASAGPARTAPAAWPAALRGRVERDPVRANLKAFSDLSLGKTVEGVPALSRLRHASGVARSEGCSGAKPGLPRRFSKRMPS